MIHLSLQANSVGLGRCCAGRTYPTSFVYKVDNSSILLSSWVFGIAGLSFARSWQFVGEPKGKAFLWNADCD